MEIKKQKPDIRHLYDMKKVLYDKEWAKTAPDFELYYMYRGIEKKDGLRYDITLIPAKMLGREFVKTKGHEHIGPYGEVYFVLEGEAIYLLQQRTKNRGENIKDVYAVKAKKGEAVAIPPFYGHVTVNSSKKKLKMANWVSNKCQSDYRPFEKMGGACYFYTKNGWLKNKNYKKVPKLKFKKPLKNIPKDLSLVKDIGKLKA